MEYESLTQDSFWNKLELVAPTAVEMFQKWIDQYKNRLEWKLFIQEPVKFHSLPFDLQLGILVRFNQEVFQYDWDIDILRSHYIQQSIYQLFMYKEGELIMSGDSKMIKYKNPGSD